ncbi:MAG: glycosyltransferase [Planctomycetota bacterium]
MKPVILLVLDKMIRAGTQRHVLHTLRSMGSDYEFHVACLEGPGSWDLEVIGTGAVLHRYAMNRIYDAGGLETLAGLHRLIRHINPAGVEALMFTAHLASAVCSGGIPMISSPREKCLWRKPRHLMLKKLANRRYRLHLANSKAVADDLTQREGVSPDQIRLVPNSLDPADFEPVSSALPPVPGRINAVVVSAFKPVKQHALLLEALATSQELISKLAVTFYGEGPLRPALEQVVARLNLGDVVRFAGSADRVPGRLQGYDFAIHPSQSEAMSNAILEAMAAGLPPVALGTDGNLECIEDGITGLLLPSPSAPTMAQGLLHMVEDAEGRKRMGREAKSRAWERYSLEAMAGAKRSAYREAFGC